MPWRENAPDWFLDALAAPVREKRIPVDGANIYCRIRGDEKAPGLVMVHGNGASSHWWDFIAPFFADNHHVVCLDLSGMGQSDTRDTYSPQRFAGDIGAVIDAMDFAAPPTLISHSFGGGMSKILCHDRPDIVKRLIAIDSPIYPPEDKYGKKHSPPRFAKRFYPDFESGLSRFRPFPPQPIMNPWIFDYIAHHSLMEEDGRWTWRTRVSPFDQPSFSPEFWPFLRSRFENLKTPYTCIYGENSGLCSPIVMDYMREIAPEQARFITIPDAHHHIMMDQPLALVSALRSVLALDS